MRNGYGVGNRYNGGTRVSGKEMRMESITELSFEEALRELETVVEKLESDGLALADTVRLYERGRALAQHCQQLLDTVALRVQQVQADESGETRVVPFALDEGDQ
jgi:exodeoxyribonuclease VII small subunit